VLPPRPLRLREEELRAQGYTVIGVDEAGRGPLAGPVVAGAVALDERFETERFAALHDSKQVSEEAREKLFEQLTQEFAWGVGEADAAEIDAINIRQASWLAMRRAVENLQARFGQTSTCPTPDASTCSPFILLDGLGYGPGPWPYEALVKGDAREACIAAASIVAKVWRDRLMRVAHERFPQYGFAQHKGYPSPAHLEALRLRGPCELHRRSFGPVRRAVQAAASEAPASKLSEPSR
jgi:ribonuclease HII